MIFTKNKEVSFRPWESNYWEDVFRRSELRLGKERVYTLAQYLNRSLLIDGDVVEMGVYRGCTAYVIATLLNNYFEGRETKKLYLCDTFEGTPEIFDKSKGDINRKGKYSDTSANYVEEKVKLAYLNSETVVGFIPDSLAPLADKKLCFAHLHLNLYQSTMDALSWLNSRMSRNGIIVIEDYGIANCDGVRKAVDEYASENGINLVYLPTGQAIIEII